MYRSFLATAALAIAVAGAGAARAQSCRSGGGVTLWLDFGGANVVPAGADDSSATPVASRLPQASTVVPPFDAAPSAPQVTRDQAIAAIVDRVRTLVQPFAVVVTTTQPAAPPYTRILVGGTAAALGLSSVEAGLAEVDCGNQLDRDVAFDFAAAQTPDYGGVVSIANVAAHEAGHTFGLEHVANPADVMYAAATPTVTLPELFTLSFAGGAYSSYGGAVTPECGHDPVDEVALLDCAVGMPAAEAGADTTAPVLDWPDSAPTVPTRFTVSVNASDDFGVSRVELYKNLELVASVAAPPYQATLTAAPAERFYVTVEAIDDAANRATATRTFVAAASGASDDGGVPDDAGATGGAPAPGSPSTPAPSGRASGCALAGAPPAADVWPLVLLGVARLRNRRRQR